MTAKEPQIGDWVRIKENVEADAYYLHDELRPGQYVKVEEILSIGINPDWCDGEINTILPYDAIELVPLTPEILKKNGFKRAEKDKNTWIWKYKRDRTFNMVPDDTIWFNKEFGRRFTTIGWMGVTSEIGHSDMEGEFVHQLQHVLRLCGIDKEITL